MRKNVSNTWEGKATLVKGKDSYYVIHCKPIVNSRFIINVYKCDDRGVVIDSNPVEQKHLDYYNSTVYDNLVDKYEHKRKKFSNNNKKKSKKKSKKKKSKTSSSKKKNENKNTSGSEE